MGLQTPAIQQLQGSITDQTGVLKTVPYSYFQLENGLLQQIVQLVNKVIGVATFTLAAQPTLALADAGFVGFVTDFAHLVMWTGAAWIFLDDCGGSFKDFALPPQGNGWQLCDGSATSILTVGATLTAPAFNTPNLTATPTYKKSAAAYTGALNAASGVTGVANSGDASPGVSGNTDNASPGLSGNTDDESSHTHGVAFGAIPLQAGGVLGVAAAGAVAFTTTVNGNTGGGSAHHHALTAAAVNAHAHGTSGITVNAHHHTIPGLAVGSLDMPNLGVLPYVRR